MTPQEKALQLKESFNDALTTRDCAMVCVDEIFEFMKMDDDYTETASNANSIWVNYFIEVKKQLQEL
jgi:hypothetical protein